MDSQNPFLTPEPHDAEHEDSQEVLAERAIADAGQSQAMFNYNQKLLEQKERELMESIALNYGRIREVERELGNLQLQLKLTSGPKKHALELLRKKIETQNEKVASVRAKHTAAKATYERLDAELKQEEAVKEQLCGELNTLVQQAAKAQLDKLEELKATLEGLYSGIMPKQVAQQLLPQQQPATGVQGQAGPSASDAAVAAAATGSALQQQGEPAASEEAAAAAAAAAAEQELLRQRREQERQAAEERRRREAEAAAARSRHVTLGDTSSSPGAPAGPTGRQAGSPAVEPGTTGSRAPTPGAAGPPAGARPKAANGTGEAPPPPAAPSAQKQRFAGFDT